MAKQSLAASTPGALSVLELPASFQAPMEPIKPRHVAPYVVFAHPKRTDEWAKLINKYGNVEEGEMFLIRPTGPLKLDVMKCLWLKHKQFWSNRSSAGQVLGTSLTEQPKPFKETIEAIVLIFIGEELIPANIQFRSVKCAGVKPMYEALAMAQTPEWANISPSHKETLAIQQSWARLFGEFALGAKRTSASTGNPYTPTQCKVSPTSAAEWRALKTFSESADAQKMLADAAARFDSQMADMKQKLIPA